MDENSLVNLLFHSLSLLGFEIGVIYDIKTSPPVLVTHSVCEPTSKFYLDMDKG